MTFDCHGQPIALPADLDGVFTQPKSIYDFHFVLQQLDPALKEIVTLVSHSQYGRYLRRYAADFVIQDYVIFISRKAPSGKSYWEGYEAGPKKFSFSHWVLICFMAYLKRPETKAQLQQRRQAIEARDARDAAGSPPATTPASSTQHTEASAMTTTAETCRLMIAETQKRVDIMLEDAQRQVQEILARAREGNPTGQDEFIHLIASNDEEDNPTGNEPIHLISDEDEDNDT